MIIKEHLDRLFIASLAEEISRNSVIWLPERPFIKGIAQEISKLTQGWWLEPSVEEAFELSQKITEWVTSKHIIYLRALKDENIPNPWTSLRLNAKTSLMITLYQALHHIDWYGRQNFPNHFVLDKDFPIYFTRQWLRKLMSPFKGKV